MTLRFNLRSKLIAYSLGITGLASGALITYDFVLERSEARQHAAETIVAVAQAVAGNLVDPVYTLEVEQIRRQLQSARAVPQILLAQALDKDGLALVDSEKEFFFQRAKPTDPELLDMARERGSAAVRVTDHAIDVLQPVRLADGETIGYVYLKSSLTQALRQQAEHAQRTATLAGVLLLFASLLAYFFARSFSAPVEKIVRAMRAVGDGDLEARVSLARGDELGTLADNLNDMVTGLKAMTAEIQREKEAADAANRAKSRFLANMSHEIRTPMNGVIGMTELLLDGEFKDERQRGYALTIRRSAESLLAIINDVLDFSKIEADKLDLEQADIVLRELVGEVIELLEDRAESKELALFAVIADSLPACVRGDPQRLRQILVNLVGNAIKFTEQGEVQVRVSAAPGHGKPPHTLRFEVRDTGIGIAPSKIDSLFRPFEQGDVSTTKRYGGTGLGLAICKQLAERMGGRIGVESEFGKGATFWFELPLPPSSRQAADSPRRVALVVDDRATDRRVVAHHLALLDLRCISASGANEALSRLRAAPDVERLDLIVLDIGASGADMIGMLAALRALAPCRETPVVVATSEAGLPAAVEAGRLGKVFELRKPARRSDLRRLVRSVLDGYDNRGQAAGHVTPAASREFAGLRILLAEDNDVNRLYMEAMLRFTGCELVSARDGNEALAQWEASRFDLLLLDWQMPGMDGLEVLARIRARETKRTPAIVITANAMQNDRERCLEAGFDDYLAKPFRKAEMLGTMRRVLHAPSSGYPPDSADKQAAASEASLCEETAIDAEKIEELRSVLSGNDATTRRVIRVFLDSVPAMLDELARARSTRDAEAAARAAHSLKSSGAYVGAMRLSAVATRIDDAFKANETSTLWHDVERLTEEIGVARDALRHYLSP